MSIWSFGTVAIVTFQNYLPFFFETNQPFHFVVGLKMTNTKGYRRGTRYMFSRDFRKKGVIHLSTYMTVYKKGDIVDIKVRHACILNLRNRW